MPPRRTRKVSQNSAGQPDGQFSKEQGMQMLNRKKELFIQQFEKEAHDRINEMEAKLDQLLATVDRVYKVELMKIPYALQNTLLKDLISADDLSVGEVTIAIKTESPEMHRPLTRKPSRKVKMRNSTIQHNLHGQNRRAPTAGPKGRTRIRSLETNNATGSPRCTSTVTAKRTQGRVAKLSDQSTMPRCKARAMTRTFSEDLSVSESFVGLATATISTSLGETLLLTEANKDDINVDLLDDVALFQMQRMKELIDYLCNKVKVNKSL